MKVVVTEVFLDGQSMEIPTALRGTLTAVHSHLESMALRRNSLLTSMIVDGVPIRLEKPIVPLKLFKRVEAMTTRFDSFAVHLVPSLQKKLRHLRNRTEVAAELATINEWVPALRLWWDLLPDLKEPLLILNLLAALPGTNPASQTHFMRILTEGNTELSRILTMMDQVVLVQDPLAMSDILEQQLCVWLDQLDRGLCLEK